LCHHMLRQVCERSFAGLYMNPSLLHRFPVAGNLREVISDVRLVDEAFGIPRVFSAQARRFLFVGHLEKVKRVDRILRSFYEMRHRLVSDWMFEIVGEGPEQHALVRLVEELKLEDHVVFSGRIPWGDGLFRAYRHADMLLMASLAEGSSRTLLEGMAAGLPVLSTAVGQAPALLSPRALVPVGQHALYSHRLGQLAADPNLLSELSQQNWDQAQAYRYAGLAARRTAFYARAVELVSDGLLNAKPDSSEKIHG